MHFMVKYWIFECNTEFITINFGVVEWMKWAEHYCSRQVIIKILKLNESTVANNTVEESDVLSLLCARTRDYVWGALNTYCEVSCACIALPSHNLATTKKKQISPATTNKHIYSWILLSQETLSPNTTVEYWRSIWLRTTNAQIIVFLENGTIQFLRINRLSWPNLSLLFNARSVEAQEIRSLSKWEIEHIQRFGSNVKMMYA